MISLVNNNFHTFSGSVVSCNIKLTVIIIIILTAVTTHFAVHLDQKINSALRIRRIGQCCTQGTSYTSLYIVVLYTAGEFTGGKLRYQAGQTGLHQLASNIREGKH